MGYEQQARILATCAGHIRRPNIQQLGRGSPWPDRDELVDLLGLTNHIVSALRSIPDLDDRIAGVIAPYVGLADQVHQVFDGLQIALGMVPPYRSIERYADVVDRLAAHAWGGEAIATTPPTPAAATEADRYAWIQAKDLIKAIKEVFGEERDDEGYNPPTQAKVSRANLPKRGKDHYEPIRFSAAFEWACEQYATNDIGRQNLSSAMIAAIKARE